MTAPLSGPQPTPRPPSDTAILAEVRRIAEQILRSNPLVNARVPSGLTRWVGNYGGEFAWFGEFQPNDPNLNMPQRGIAFRRDDPQGRQAFALFDPNPKLGVPLRQRIFMSDADGRTLLAEGDTGGVGYPYWPVAMNRSDQGGFVQTAAGTDQVIFSGRTANMGRHVELQGFASSTASDSGVVTLRVSNQVGNSVSTTFAYTGSGAVNIAVDLAASSLVRDSAVLTVDVFLRKTAGSGNVAFVPYSVFNFTRPSA